MVYALVNVLLTGYLAQIQSTLPLYLNRFVGEGAGLSEGTLSLLFTGHGVLAAIAQLPVARWLRRYRPAQGPTPSAPGPGFGLVWQAGTSYAFKHQYSLPGRTAVRPVPMVILSFSNACHGEQSI